MVAGFIFKETYFHAIDEKGRIALPAKWRRKIKDNGEGEILTITKGFDRCLFIYTESGWRDIITNRLSKMPIGRKDVIGFIRFFVSGSFEVTPDNQGRINIPQYLREYANLKEKIVLNGAGYQIEVWDENNWKGYMDENKESYEDFARKFFDYVEQ